MRKGEALEEYVKHVYQLLLNLKDEGIEVEKNKKIEGRSGTKWEFDVYYEFSNAGITHKVAIECKDYGRPLDQGKIAEFGFKLQDVGGISGMVVSSRGFQSGSSKVAKSYGIKLLKTDELPPIPQLMAKRLSAVALPDEDYWGEPFWVIMEHVDGKVTGSIYGTQEEGRDFIPMFLSKYHAEMVFNEKKVDSNIWCIRGLPRFALRAFILMLTLFEKRGFEPMILFRPPGDISEIGYAGLVTSTQLLAKEYYCGSIPGVYSV